MSTSSNRQVVGSPQPQLSSTTCALLSHTNLLSLDLAYASTQAKNTSNIELEQLQQNINLFLPSTTWYRIPVEYDPSQIVVRQLRMRHGTKLPELEVRVLYHHCLIGEAIDRMNELDSALTWLLDSLKNESRYGVIGLDCESDCQVGSDGEVRLLQLSTGTRCLLIRIPDQQTIDEFITQQAKNKRSTTHLFTPTFIELMKSRSIYKSGAELWNDCLDLWSYCGLEVNQALNMSWIYRNSRGGAMSLVAILKHCQNNEDVLFKDRETTTSCWGGSSLSIRQLIYAAIDGQSSWSCGANQSQIPMPFSMTDIPRTWLERAARWKCVSRPYKLELDKIKEEFERSNRRLSSTVKADLEVIDASHRYFAQYMQGEEPFHPFVYELFTIAFPTQQRAAESIPTQALLEVNADPIFHLTPDLVIDRENVNWWFNAKIEPNFDYSYDQSPWWKKLDPEQKESLNQSDDTRIMVIVGPPGSGKTEVAAAEVVRALTRSTSIILDKTSPVVKAAAQRQRVLCIAQSDAGARVLAAAIAHLLPPSKLILFVSPEFAQQWEEGTFPHLRDGGYVDQFPLEGERHDDRDVLVCSADFALTTQFPTRLRHRQTVIIDEANQLWFLRAILLLRKLPHTERLILVGDDRQLGAVFGRQEVESVLTAAHQTMLSLTVSINTTDVGPKTGVPLSFRSPRMCILPHSYRLKPHLGHMISELFYDDALVVRGSDRSRVAGWIDIAGQPERHSDANLGWLNQVEVNCIVHLWNYYAQRPGFTMDHIAIICMFDAQRILIIEQQPAMKSRCFTIEEFQGRSADVVLLTLAAARITPSMNDSRRANVACSRASSKLYIIGDRSALIASLPDSVWHEISEYEYRDLEEVFPELRLDPEVSFPALKPSRSPPITSHSPPITSIPGGHLPALELEGSAAAAPVSANSQWSIGAPAVPTPAQAPTQPTRKPDPPAPVSSKSKSSSRPPPGYTPSSSSGETLDSRLVKAVSTMVTHQHYCLLHDLESAFKSYHKKEWSTYSNAHIESFVEAHSDEGSTDQHFELKPNPADPTNPYVIVYGENIQLPQPEGETESHLSPPPPSSTATASSTTSSSTIVVHESAEAAAERLRNQKRAAEKKARLAAEKAKALEARAQAAKEAREARERELALQAAEAELKAQRRKEAKAAAKAKKAEEAAAALQANKQLIDVAPITPEVVVPTTITCGFCKAQLPLDTETCVCGNDINQGQQEQKDINQDETTPPTKEESKEEVDHALSLTSSTTTQPTSTSSSSTTQAPILSDSIYPSKMSPDSYMSLEALNELSKAAKKKLQWLCCSCEAPNSSGSTCCELCGAKKPHVSVLRFSKPETLKSLVKSFKSPEGLTIVYENEWVKIAISNDKAVGLGGYHFVTKQRVPPGTILLMDQFFRTELGDEPLLTFGMNSRDERVVHTNTRLPNLIQMRILAKSIAADPNRDAASASLLSMNGDELNEDQFEIMADLFEHLRGDSRFHTQSQMWSWMANAGGFKKPKELSESSWRRGIFTACQVNRQLIEQHPDHQTCTCKVGYFQLARQASFLDSTCWPNCATVVYSTPSSDSKERAIMSICELEPGTILRDVGVRSGDYEWMILPPEGRNETCTDYRNRCDYDIDCQCDRCMNAIDSVTQLPVGHAADELLEMVLPDEEEDNDAIDDEYEHLITSLRELKDLFSDVTRKMARRKQHLKDASDSDVTDDEDEEADEEEAKEEVKSDESKKKKNGKSSVTPTKAPTKTPQPKKKKDTVYVATKTIQWFNHAFTFLTTHPLHRCHWRMFTIRRRLIDLIRSKELYRDQTTWRPPLEPGLTDEGEKLANDLEMTDAYMEGLIRILHVIHEDILANKQYFLPLDPMKSQSFQLLDEFYQMLIRTSIILIPSVSDIGPSDAPTRLNHHTADGSFRLPTLTFPAIGSKEGQDHFLKHLLTEVDPAGPKLKQLGYPKREKFGDPAPLPDISSE